ncbi:MAG: type IV secretory system conjugative DNA transfer family protein [Clostridia bacterium]|nr:type IV secretory system conjugative DNA transfer family protein [Clostridia bacterium]
MARKILPNYIKRHGAEFESMENFIKASTLSDTTATKLETSGVPMTRLSDNTYVTTRNDLHCFIIGDSGSGKTRRLILPTIHLMAKAGESMVISDPKGELHRYTAEMLENKGYEVLTLNFRNPEQGNKWNPLGLVEKLYHKGDRKSIDTAFMLLGDVVSTLSNNIKSEKDPYWSMAAISTIKGIIEILLEYGDEGSLTFENVSNVARDIFTSFNYPSGRDFRNLNEFFDSLPDTSSIKQNMSTLMSVTSAKTTSGCIISMLNGMLSLYTSQQALLDLFSESEIDIDSIGKKPTALFFILPDDSDALYPIATVFVKQVYSSLISLADAQPDGVLPNRTVFLLDEFANFAKMEAIGSMLTASRSRGIRFVLVCQSMDQLSQKYGLDGMEILLANCRAWIYLSCRNLPFLERLEKLCGEYLSPYTGDRHPLITVSELQHFNQGKVLVLNDRCRPMIGYLDRDYSEIDFGKDVKHKLKIDELIPINPRKKERNAYGLRYIFDRIAEKDPSFKPVTSSKPFDF